MLTEPLEAQSPFFENGLECFKILGDVTRVHVLVELSRKGGVYSYFLDGAIIYKVANTKYIQEVNSSRAFPKEKLKQSDSSNLPKSALFTVLILIAVLSMTNPTVYGAVKDALSPDDASITALKNVVFTTPTGPFTTSAIIGKVKSDLYEDYAYSFDDPRPIQSEIAVITKNLDPRVNRDVLSAILAYSHVYALDQIRSNTGLGVTEEQVLAAIQLSIWKQSAIAYNNYKVNENSITDAMVRSLSTAIISWAASQAANKPVNSDILQILLPKAQPRIDASAAQRTVDDISIRFGPYTVRSGARIVLNVSINGGYVENYSGVQVSKIVSGETFYVVFPKEFSGKVSVNLTSTAVDYELVYGSSYVWLQQIHENVALSFELSAQLGSNGVLVVKVFDSNTQMPVPLVGVQIKSLNTVVSSQYTDTNGVAQQTLPVGEYTIKISPTEKYLEYDEVNASISFIGDVQTINIMLVSTEAVANFFAIDSSTLGSAGYTEALVYKSDGTPVKRLAFLDGTCRGIILEPGSYIISAYKTTGDYGISGRVPFIVQQGQAINVNLNLPPNTGNTTVSLENTYGKSGWKFTFYQDGAELFFIDSTGVEDVRLPFGAYQIKADSSDGVNKMPLYDFSVTALNEPVIIPSTVGDTTVTFSFIDTIYGEPIPELVVGIFDSRHHLIEYKRCDSNGRVDFTELRQYDPYYVNVVAAPPTVSGYSASGNKFLAVPGHHEIALYSITELSGVTQLDAIYRLPNVTYVGNYVYPMEISGELQYEENILDSANGNNTGSAQSDGG
jgi:hypothetical protein